jgi:hypothetical protein
MDAFGNFRVWNPAEQGVFLSRPTIRKNARHGRDAKNSAMLQHRIARASQTHGNRLVFCRAQDFFFRPRPFLRFVRSERRDVKRDTLPCHILHRPAKSPGQLLVKIAAQQFGFPRGPTSWWRFQPDTPPLAFFDNFLDGASDAAGKDGVGHFPN